MGQQNTLYTILGIEPSSSAEEVEAAYAARLSEAQDAGMETSLLKMAHDNLRVPELRAAYDRRLARQSIVQSASIEMVESETGRRSYPLLFLVLLIAVGAVYWWKKPVTVSSRPSSIARVNAVDSPSLALPAPPSAETETPPEAMPARENPVSWPSNGEVAERVGPTAGTKTVVYTHPICKPGFDPQCLAWSVFSIRQRHKAGSGVLIAPDRILTNCHVLAGGAIDGLVAIHRQTNKATKVEHYTRLNDEDVCLLHAPGAGGDVISWGASDSLGYGDTIYAFGHPGGSSDVAWSEARLIARTERNGEKYLVTSNYCPPGSSGGPLLDDKGRLVGVVTAVQVDRSQNDGTVRYGACLSITETTARKLLGRTFFPIALAPAQFH